MAEGTLTSTLTITGTVNGQRVGISHTYTLENVYDAGTFLSEDNPRPALMTDNTGGGPEITFVQDTPNYLMGNNPDTDGVVNVLLTAGAGDVGFLLTPGALFCITGTLGTALNTNSITGFTLANVTKVQAVFVAPFATSKASILVAYNGIS